MKRICFQDSGDPVSLPLSRFRSIFSLRTGIYSPLDRAVLAGDEIVLRHPDSAYADLIALAEQELRPGARISASGQSDEIREITGDKIPGLVDNAANAIAADLPLFLKQNEGAILHSPGQGVLAAGSAENLFVHKDAQILPGVSILTEDGPVVIDQGARITPFSVLSGPLYVGPVAMLDHVKIGGSIVGRGCRLGGEIEKSILGDFTNKHHEGFLGHSIAGSWVNLGALTTTSDLKNNYGQIRLRIGQSDINTGRIKFGSILGDCVKTAIGTMLNTGTVVDAGCNVFGGRVPGYLPVLSWGVEGARYNPERFLADCATVFARRKQAVPASMKGLVARAVSLDSGRPVP
jgi:UDP-N-acetylglucosamine diphosphorylase/glucosamine-1-phosphate N-acetyltransferase